MTFSFRSSGFSLLAVSVLAALPGLGAEGDVEQIMDGVSEIRIGGAIPGPVVAFGEEAFVVVPGASGKSLLGAIAASRYGKGRVVACGHEGLLGVAAADGDTLFMVSAARWAGAKASPRVALFRQGEWAKRLADAGFDTTEVSEKDLENGVPGFDVLIAAGYHFDGPEAVGQLDGIRAFIRGGGGFLTAICPWGWKYYDPAKNVATELGMNRLLADAGLVWSDGMLGATEAGAYKRVPADARLLGAREALAALVDHVSGKATLDVDALRQAGTTLSSAALAIPPEETTFLPMLLEVTAKHGGDEYPQPDKPVKTDNPFARLSATFFLAKSKSLPAEKITAHPGAAAFPGAVPAEAERVDSTLAIDTSRPAWHGTGLYAAPGELITVTVPATAAGKGLTVRIGCHTDSLWGHDQWKRFPEITRSAPVQESRTLAANPFGGLIYIDVPGKCELGVVEVTVANAVRAPYYVYGKTTLAEWRDTIRNYPAPWAELEVDSVVLTVPSHEIRALEDPESLMAFWDYSMDTQADLAGIPRDRERPERIVADVQISAGYMHSGYPIMTWLDAPSLAVSLERLTTTGSWGHFHELGHNHQSGHWTFGGTGEVTNNLFTVYTHEVACRLPTPGHPALKPENVEKMHKEYFGAGAPFEKWQSNPFLALTMYLQVRDAFGWRPFCNVFAGYRDDPADALPKNDAEKRDQFMVRLSREIGHNLGPFFETWGVPTSEAARASIADLPGWMPPSFPPQG